MNSFTGSADRMPSASQSSSFTAQRIKLKLPATSANLGAGFDTLALALSLALEIDAVPAAEFSLKATGRNTEICGSLHRNLMIDVYRKTLAAYGCVPVPLTIEIHNEIPIGMGCGSSAAVRLAGVALANHFGGLGLSSAQTLDEAARLEGHPDNAAACWLGGLTVATFQDGRVQALRVLPATSWRVLLVLPDKALATTAARAVLPSMYSREDAVFNIQCASLFAAAFAHGRGDLLHTAMRDRIHQPFRGDICPLLPSLAPLAGSDGVLGVALSGAGPSVLLVLDQHCAMDEIRSRVGEIACGANLIECAIETSPSILKTSTSDR